MICSEATIVNSQPRGGQAITMRCKRWSCDICRPENSKIVKRRARRGQPTTMLTLTSNPATAGCADERARLLVTGFRELRRLMLRHFGLQRVPFLAVFERTKKGEPHLHILLRCGYVSQRWISDQMGRLTGAPIVDIRQVKGRRKAAAYVAKYIGKSLDHFEGCKRYWSTTNWLDPWREEWGEAPKLPGHWVRHQAHFFVVAAQLESEGWQIDMPSDHYLRFEAPP